MFRVTCYAQCAEDLQLVYNPYEIYVRARNLSEVTCTKGRAKSSVLAPPAGGTASNNAPSFVKSADYFGAGLMPFSPMVNSRYEWAIVAESF